MRDLNKIPDGLPVPNDDGECNHLKYAELPAVELKTTSGRYLKLDSVRDPTVIFFYPRTGEPSKPAPPDWDLIPGARGCTPQSCGFRDLYKDFQTLGYQVFGASTQVSEYQQEFADRNHIPFEILSDSDFELTIAMKLPTFTYSGMRLLKRMAWIIENGKISKVFYPVFPPNENAATVLEWLRSQ